jgi:hypothetical protein
MTRASDYSLKVFVLRGEIISHPLAVYVYTATNLPIAIDWHAYIKTGIIIVTRFAITAFVF